MPIERLAPGRLPASGGGDLDKPYGAGAIIGGGGAAAVKK
jgi:hypothetical protein